FHLRYWSFWWYAVGEFAIAGEAVSPSAAAATPAVRMIFLTRSKVSPLNRSYGGRQAAGATRGDPGDVRVPWFRTLISRLWRPDGASPTAVRWGRSLSAGQKESGRWRPRSSA